LGGGKKGLGRKENWKGERGKEKEAKENAMCHQRMDKNV